RRSGPARALRRTAPSMPAATAGTTPGPTSPGPRPTGSPTSRCAIHGRSPVESSPALRQPTTRRAIVPPKQEHREERAMEAERADYVIVGAGSAGCVLANRLSADGSRVILLEAGPRDLNPWIHIPAGVLKLLKHPKVNWNFETDPEEGTGNRAIHWPRGRVLVGSSSINGMLFVRGNPADYDAWAQTGCPGWRYEELVPYFKSIERYGPGDPEHRGKSGPLLIEDYRTVLPLTHRFVEAAQQAGFAFTRDLSGAQAEGVGYSQMSRNGRFRGSTARTFLAAARR